MRVLINAVIWKGRMIENYNDDEGNANIARSTGFAH